MQIEALEQAYEELKENMAVNGSFRSDPSGRD